MSDLKGTDIKGIDFKGTDLKGMDIKGTVPPAAKRFTAGGTVPFLNLWIVKGTVPLTWVVKGTVPMTTLTTYLLYLPLRFCFFPVLRPPRISGMGRPSLRHSAYSAVAAKRTSPEELRAVSTLS